MRNIVSLFLVLVMTLLANGYISAKEISIIPEPVSMEVGSGVFKLPKKVSITIPDVEGTQITKDFLLERISTPTGYPVQVKQKGKSTILFELNEQTNTAIGNEGYSLQVKPKQIIVRANSAAGLFYGAQTLVQLFPVEIESKELINDVAWEAPCVTIEDYPRVGWRGLMLDVTRHFFSVDDVKQFLDNMTRFKFNMFHWHLSDDEGWRVEIKSLPRLTEIGAWRAEKTGRFGSMSHPDKDEPKTYGGYYTQEQIKDIVAYAAERFITIMPEIDVPGHSSALLAAYPEMACFPESGDHFVRSGEPFLDWSTPRPTAIFENTVNPASDKTYEILDKVFEELAELFPFEYIHTGGDEAPYTFWQKSDDVKALMEKEGLKSMAEVQAYFSKRLEKIIISKGKKMIGWDEILEGGINPSTALMSWRGIQYGIEASNSGHYVVMSPQTHVYIDLMQGDASTDARVYNSLRLNQTYKFDPVPPGANPEFVLGGQGNLWTEQIYNIRQAEYMAFPRALAVAESVWSPLENKEWNNFIRKTEVQFERFDYAETKYSRAMFDPIVKVKKEGDQYFVHLTTEIEGLNIHTSFDASEPDYFYPIYTEPLEVPKDAYVMRIVTYRGKEKTGRMMSIPIEDLKRRAAF